MTAKISVSGTQVFNDSAQVDWSRISNVAFHYEDLTISYGGGSGAVLIVAFSRSGSPNATANFALSWTASNCNCNCNC